MKATQSSRVNDELAGHIYSLFITNLASYFSITETDEASQNAYDFFNSEGIAKWHADLMASLKEFYPDASEIGVGTKELQQAINYLGKECENYNLSLIPLESFMKTLANDAQHSKQKESYDAFLQACQEVKDAVINV